MSSGRFGRGTEITSGRSAHSSLPSRASGSSLVNSGWPSTRTAGPASHWPVLSSAAAPASAVEDLSTLLKVSDDMRRFAREATRDASGIGDRTVALATALQAENGRELRYDLYDLFLRFPQPLASRRRRLGVKERLAADGSVVVALDESDVVAKARELIDAGLNGLEVYYRAYDQGTVRLLKDVAMRLRLVMTGGHSVNPRSRPCKPCW